MPLDITPDTSQALVQSLSGPEQVVDGNQTAGKEACAISSRCCSNVTARFGIFWRAVGRSGLSASEVGLDLG